MGVHCAPRTAHCFRSHERLSRRANACDPVLGEELPGSPVNWRARSVHTSRHKLRFTKYPPASINS